MDIKHNLNMNVVAIYIYGMIMSEKLGQDFGTLEMVNSQRENLLNYDE